MTMNRFLYTIFTVMIVTVFVSCENEDADIVNSVADDTVLTSSTRSVNDNYISDPTELHLFTYTQPTFNEYFYLTKPCKVTLSVSFNRGLNSWSDLDETTGSHAKILSLSGSNIGKGITIDLADIISDPYPSATYVVGSGSIILSAGLHVFNVSFTTDLGTQTGFSGLHGSTDATATFDYQFYYK